MPLFKHDFMTSCKIGAFTLPPNCGVTDNFFCYFPESIFRTLNDSISRQGCKNRDFLAADKRWLALDSDQQLSDLMAHFS